MKTIFINIASYRDPELINTLNDAIKQAEHPNRVHFGILNQDITPFKFTEHPHVKCIWINPADTKGTGWARNKINNELYDGEDYFLQVDSHSRFDEHWDSKLIADLENNGDKAVLTGYPPHYALDEEYGSYNVERPYFSRNVMTQHSNYAFYNSRGKVPTENYQQTLIVSGGFIFAQGKFVTDTLYTEYLNPWQDQEILSCLGYIKGYKFFVPKMAKIWHCYNNNNDEKEAFRPLSTNENYIDGYEPDAIKVIRKWEGDIVDRWISDLHHFS